MSSEFVGTGQGHTRHFATLRRLYLYLVTLICLIALQGNFQGLASELATYWSVLGGHYLVPTYDYINQRLLEKSSYLLVTALFLLLHYGLIVGWTLRDPQERDSLLRKLFLWASTAVALGYCISLVAHLLAPVLSRIMGLDFESSGFYGMNYVVLVLPLGLSGAILVQGGSLLHTERDCGGTRSDCQSLEALFFSLVNVAGLLLVASLGHTVLFRASLLPVLHSGAHVYVSSMLLTISTDLAVILALLLALHQVANWRRRIGQGRPHLWSNLLHTLTLYGGLLTGLVVFLQGLWLLLQALLGLLPEGADLGELALGLQVAPSLLATVPLGVGYWLWFQRRLARAPETSGLATWRTVPRQLYLYSGISVTLFWVATGSLELILILWDQGRVFASLPVSPEATLMAAQDMDLAWTDHLARLLTGGAALCLLWRQIRRLGREPVAPILRTWHLLPRRLYLYGVTIVSTLTLLFVCGRVLQELLERLTGWEVPDLLSTGEFTRDMASLVVLVVVLACHVRLLRQSWGPPPAAPPEAVEASSLRQELAAVYQERHQVTARIKTLEQRLAELASPAQSTERREP